MAWPASPKPMKHSRGVLWFGMVLSRGKARWSPIYAEADGEFQWPASSATPAGAAWHPQTATGRPLPGTMAHV